MSRYFRAKIKENLPLNRNHKLLSLININEMNEPLPGQFYMLNVSRGYDPLLKRAFSLFRRTQDGFQILYRIRGKGTSMLSNMKEGDVIDVIGPLGNPYPELSAKSAPVVVAGGVGIASVFPLIERLSKSCHVFYGAVSRVDLLVIDKLREISRELFVSTDDGSYGYKGTVVDSLKNYLARHSIPGSKDLLYACGPKAMLEKIAEIAISNDITAYASFEENMACGLGACLGCAVRVRNKPSPATRRSGKSSQIYKKVCRDGPVFNIKDIVW